MGGPTLLGLSSRISEWELLSSPPASTCPQLPMLLLQVSPRMRREVTLVSPNMSIPLSHIFPFPFVLGVGRVWLLGKLFTNGKVTITQPTAAQQTQLNPEVT